ncbi:hypothetical protein D918_04268 [Trichuris suis]|nr:hypothetical protein D918_04268 [Trichuris suis]
MDVITSNVVLLFALFACGGSKEKAGGPLKSEKPIKAAVEQTTKSPAEQPSPTLTKHSKTASTTATTVTVTKSPSSTMSEVFKWDEESKIEPGLETTLTKKAWETESAYLASATDPTIISTFDTATATATAVSTLASTYKSAAPQRTVKKPPSPQSPIKGKK